MGSGKPIWKMNKPLQASEKKPLRPIFQAQLQPRGVQALGQAYSEAPVLLGKYLLLGEYIHCLQLLQGADIALSLLFSFSSQMDCLASSRRWLDKNLDSHFLTWLEIPRNFLTRSKHVGGFISNLQLQGSFFLLPLPFSTLTAFPQRNHHLC